MRTILTRLAAAAVLILLAVPAQAGVPRHYPRGSASDAGPWLEQGQFRLRLGMFEPRGDSNFWDVNKLDFTGGPNDFNDIAYGGDLLWSLNPYASIMVSLQYYEGSANQFYQPLPPGFDTVSDFGRPVTSIGHTTRLEITPLTVGFVFYPAGRRAPVIPYLGLGGGLYWWRYREAGDFCAFDTSVSPIACIETSQEYTSDGVTAGFFGVAGLDFPVRPTWSVFVEGRIHRADASLSSEFASSGADKLDLSGTEWFGGFAWRF